MKIGYPCINRSIGCKSDRTFRIKNYSEERLKEIVENNLSCLLKILRFNVNKELLFFRITSDLVPFASHPICKFPWQVYFGDHFREIGDFITKNKIRISMHPDQFIVLNSKKKEVLENSVRELKYQSDVMEAMKLDKNHKIQIHVGGVYGDKKKSIRRFNERYHDLNETIKKRLVIENDDRSYTVSDCLLVSKATGIPVLFDYFHHQLNSNKEDLSETLGLISDTWKRIDGIPMVDYSSQGPEKRPKSHAEKIDIGDFENFISRSRPYDIDIMLEIKDKEKSALKALKVAKNDKRFILPQVVQ
jgi:UV DNA damage endonuclease